MNRLNRRRFLTLTTAGVASAALVACGNESPSAEDLNPTQIPDVAGAPPTLAPMSTPPSSNAAAGGEQASSGDQAASGGPATINVSAVELAFEPAEFSVAPGDTIHLTNDGMLEHDLAVDAWGGVVIAPLNAGEEGDYTVPADAQVGETLDFYCSIPGHKEAGMVGKLTIVEAGAAGGEEATPEEEGAAGGAIDEVSVSAFEMGFDPAEFDVTPGTKITLTNDGMLEHDFAIDDLGGVLIGPFGGGESGEYTVPEDVAPGTTFDFYCSIPGHKESGMVGKLTIVEAGAAPAGGGEEATADAEESPAAGGAEAAAGGGGDVEVSAIDLAFEPKEFEVSAGSKITLTNNGMLEHDLAVDAWGGVVIDVLAGGESGEYTVPEDVAAGDTFDFYCSIPGHKEAGMTGTITIV